MDNLNNIPNVGNWGDAASKLNDNFNKVKQAVTTVENTSKNNKGYFTSLSALNTAFPSPRAGQTAYVYGEASSTNYYIYNAVNGAWVASSIEAPAVGVDLAGYTKTGGSTKTTKEVEDEIAQLAGDLSEYAKIDGTSNVLSEIVEIVDVDSTPFSITPLKEKEVGVVFTPSEQWITEASNYTSRLISISRDTSITSLKSVLYIDANFNGTLTIKEKLKNLNPTILQTFTSVSIKDKLSICIKVVSSNTIKVRINNEEHLLTTTVAETIRDNDSIIILNGESGSTGYYYWGIAENLRLGSNLSTLIEEEEENTYNVIAENIQYKGAESTIVPLNPLGEMDLGFTITPDNDWNGSNGNMTARLIYIGDSSKAIELAVNFDGIVYFRVRTGSTYSASVFSDESISKGLSVVLSFGATTTKMKINESKEYIIDFEGEKIKNNGGIITFKPAYSNGGIDYYIDATLSNLRVGKYLRLSYVDRNYVDKGSKYRVQTLSEKVDVFNNTVKTFSVKTLPDNFDIAFTINNKVGWSENRVSWGSNILEISKGRFNYILKFNPQGKIYINYGKDTIMTAVESISKPETLRVVLGFRESGLVLRLNDLEEIEIPHLETSRFLDTDIDVVLNSDNGYPNLFYEGTYYNLRMGIALSEQEVVASSDTPTEPTVPVVLERKIQPLRFGSNYNTNSTFSIHRLIEYESPSRIGLTTTISKKEDRCAAYKTGVFSIDKAGYTSIGLPVRIGGNKNYLLDAKVVSPSNHSSVQMVRKGYDTKNEYIHPAIGYSPTAIGGYNYFMFVSNYPMEQPRYEDDDFLVSTNGLDWVRVEPFLKAASGEPRLPRNVFLSGTDFGRENAFVPIPPAGSTFKMNGVDFTPIRTLKHDPEICVKDGYVYLYGYYNFFSENDLGVYDNTRFHRFVVVLRTNNLIDWEICRNDNSTIAATEDNLKELFTQSSVDGKDNYIRFFDWLNDADTMGQTNMQVVENTDTGVWYAYYKTYGVGKDFSFVRYSGTSNLSFDWSTHEVCTSNKVSTPQEHPDIKYLEGKYYWFSSDFIMESTDGVTFTQLPIRNCQTTLPFGKAYKTDVCIGENGHLFIANSGVNHSWSKPQKGQVPDVSFGSVSSVVYKINSFADFIDFAKNGGEVGSIAAHVSIYPKDELATHYPVTILTPNDKWSFKTLVNYDFKGGEEVKVDVFAYTDMVTSDVQFGDIIVE